MYLCIKLCFAFQKIEKAMSDSSVYCNLCCHLVEKRNERVLCLKKKRQVQSVTEHWSPSFPAIGN